MGAATVYSLSFLLLLCRMRGNEPRPRLPAKVAGCAFVSQLDRTLRNIEGQRGCSLLRFVLRCCMYTRVVTGSDQRRKLALRMALSEV
jgi:hypothetical protein